MPKMDLIVRRFDTGEDTSYQFHEVEDLVKTGHGKKHRQVVFVSSNKNKVKELASCINSKFVDFSKRSIDLPELQHSDIHQIVQAKCIEAFKQVNKMQRSSPNDIPKYSVLVEDVSLEFKALKGMPGPYIKWFLDAIGPSGLHKMLAGFEDKSAEAVCCYALMDSESSIILCMGCAQGTIVEPRGNLGWGWDSCFEEQRSGKTFGEMDPEMKQRFSHRSSAITILKKYLTLGENYD